MYVGKPVILNNFKRRGTSDSTIEKFLVNEDAKYTDNNSHAMLAMDCLSFRNQMHVFHWQTEVGDAHKALGDFYDDFLDQVDNLMEIVMGKYGRYSVKAVGTLKPLQDLKDVKIEEVIGIFLADFKQYRDEVYKGDPEIVNVMDEIVASTEKLKYLLTMS